jgi:hypothetical protein
VTTAQQRTKITTRQVGPLQAMAINPDEEEIGSLKIMQILSADAPMR